MHVLARERKGVDSGEGARGALGVVAGDGDLAVAHAVADEQDDVLRGPVDEGVADRGGLVAVEARRTAVVADGGGRGDRRAEGRDEDRSRGRDRSRGAGAPKVERGCHEGDRSFVLGHRPDGGDRTMLDP